MDESRIYHEVVTEQEQVDDPLIVKEIKCGLAKCPQLEGKTFIGVTLIGFIGQVDDDDEYSGDLVLTVELAEALIELLAKSVAKARGQGRPS